MRADASGQFSLLVISHHLRATEVCAAAEQPLADLAQCFGWLEHVACDFTHLQNPLERQLSQHLEVKAPWRLPWRWRDRWPDLRYILRPPCGQLAIMPR